jgi:hypothetical protein
MEFPGSLVSGDTTPLTTAGCPWVRMADSIYFSASRSEFSSSNISHSITDSGKVP